MCDFSDSLISHEKVTGIIWIVETLEILQQILKNFLSYSIKFKDWDLISYKDLPLFNFSLVCEELTSFARR